jgi:hypothetical protein
MPAGRKVNPWQGWSCVSAYPVSYTISETVWKVYRPVSFWYNMKKKTSWRQSASELYRPSDRRLSAKLVPTFADKESRVVSATDLYGRIRGFIDRSSYFFFQVAPQLYLRGWVDPIPDPLLLRKSNSAGNRTRDLLICSQKLWPLNHSGTV